MASGTVAERLWSRVNKNGPIMPHMDTNCWVWTGGQGSKGYGTIWVKNRMHRTHRVAYELEKGTIPEGLLVLHACDNPICVRPEHLSVGTNQQNVQEAFDRGLGRDSRGEKHNMAVLTEDQVLEIRRRYALEGSTHREFAQEFGVSKATITMLLTRKTWTHI